MSYELFDPDKQIADWKRKNQAIGDWLEKHKIDHPDFEARFREYNNALIKIQQLKARKEPLKGDARVIYRIPSIQPNNQF